jgi:LPXTG-motif cell wall-anchored protein
VTGIATAGQYANVGTAVDNNGDGSTVSATDPSHYLGVVAPVPGITIEKSTNEEDADSAPGPSITVGETVTWTYVVTNTGDVDLTGVIVTDDVLGDVCTIGDLDIGDSETCEVTGIATAGQYANVGTAVDNNGDGSTVSATDPSHYFGQDVDASATIGDTVWSDDNANGKQDNGEKGIAGATVRLTLPDGSTADTTTNTSGLYLFAALDAGTYKVEVILSSIPKPSEGDLKLTTAGSFTVQLAEGQSYLDADFGVVATLPNTGIESDQIAVVALTLVLVGSMALFATRRRRAHPGEDVIS